jgi:chromosome segregation ATPase
MAENANAIDLTGLAEAVRDLENLNRKILEPLKRGVQMSRRVISAEGDMRALLQRVAQAEVDCLAAEKVREAKVAACTAAVAAAEASKDRAVDAAREATEQAVAAREEAEQRLSSLRDQIRVAEERREDLRRLLGKGV